MGVSSQTTMSFAPRAEAAPAFSKKAWPFLLTLVITFLVALKSPTMSSHPANHPTKKRRLLRGALVFLGILAAIVACGAIYEANARRTLPTKFPLSGQRVDIGGRKLHLDCRGQGSPTVVFEDGLGTAGALGWTAVLARVSPWTRACAYSRAGILGSDPASGVRHARAITDDLHALLAQSGEKLPIVLAGHSLGGIFAMVYAQKFPSDVAGMVFVDASHPDMKQRMGDAGLHLNGPPLGAFRVASALHWTGIIRILVGNDDAESAYTPSSISAMYAEAEAADQSLIQARNARNFGDRPLFVLTAGKVSDEFLQEAKLTADQGKQFQSIWRDLQKEQASWSTRSKHEMVEDSAHHIQETKPERVVEAVRWVVDSIRADKSK